MGGQQRHFLNLQLGAIAALLALALSISAVGATPDQWRRGGFTTDFSKASVPFTEIFSGGPPKDGIPSIDDPRFEPATDVDWIEDLEPVIRLELDGKVKAYPLKILIWHEIVNDTLAGTPVAVTYCPLCNSSIAFDRRFEGEILDFGTTGLLRNSDLVMYDRQSESWWQQFTGEAIVGSHTGKALHMIPSRVEGFAQLKAKHPDAMVLSIPTPARRDYGRNPYEGYDSRSAPYPFFQGDLPADVNPMARVVVIRDGPETHAVLLSHLRDNRSVTISKTVEMTWAAGQASVLDSGATRNGRDIGNVTVLKTSGGSGIPIVHDVTFAFVVHAFHPELGIIGVD